MVAMGFALGNSLVAGPLTATNIVVGTNTYVPFTLTAAAGDKVFLEADPALGKGVRAMQRSLGYREVEYKGLAFSRLAFAPVDPLTNGSALVYDYTSQTNSATNLIGALTGKKMPLLIGPDGNAYIADGHHTVAGYLMPSNPARPILPGYRRLIFGIILTNFYDSAKGPVPVNDDWWRARVEENNAYLYGADGNQLALPTDPGAAAAGPLIPSGAAMPTTPSTLSEGGAAPMTDDLYRSLAWGIADGIVNSAFDDTGRRTVGFSKKSKTGDEIHFVEFCWADFLRKRIVWDNAKAGFPLGSTNPAANVMGASLGFFAAVANGIAMSRSEAYRDQYGRGLTDYTNTSLFSPNTAAWARFALGNVAPPGTNFFHLYWFDDSRIEGPIDPSARSTNILHINTTAGVTLSNAVLNISTIFINTAGSLKTAFRDARMPNSTLRYPPGSGPVVVPTGTSIHAKVVVNDGALDLDGSVSGHVNIGRGALKGSGAIDGSLVMGKDASLALMNTGGTLHVEGPVSLNGTTSVQASKSGSTLKCDRIDGSKIMYFNGALVVSATGDSLAAGDTLKPFQAASYSGSFASMNLPALDPGLSWDTTKLAVDGVLRVVKP